MTQAVLRLSVLLLTFCVWAQSPSPYEIENRAIRRAKELSIASLERSLPKVTLEFFLTYEGGGAPIKWEVNHCGEQPRDAVVDCDRDSIMCVEADVALKDGRTATVLVSVGTFKKGPVDAPTVYGVKVTYPGGTIHRMPRLSDLPIELQRPLPKGPRDLPPPVSGLFSALQESRF